MHVSLLEVGRVIWVKSHVLGKVERPLRIKKEANMESKVGKMKLFIVIISRASFSPVVKDSLSYMVISGLF